MPTLPKITTSHSASVQDALIAALHDNAALQQLLTDPYIYAGTAPRGAQRQYIVWLDTTERPQAKFGAGGTEGTDTLAIVANGPGGREAKRIYARIVAALSYPYPALAVPDVLSSLRCELTQVYDDPADANGLTVRGIVRLNWRAYATAT
jgi:Protein of unknown function (DUF3168)